MRAIQRLHDWLVEPEGRAAYVVLFVFSLLPFAVARAIGTWESFTAGCNAASAVVWKGYRDAYNWWIWPVVLPGSLWLLRWTSRSLFGPRAAILSVVDKDDLKLAAQRLDRVRHDARSTLGVLALMAVIIPAEFWSVGAAYLANHCPAEKDWTVFFLAGRVSRPLNFLHVALAYPAQYVAGFLEILTFVLFFRHNWLYLRWIYQRHRSQRGYPSITLKFKDLDCCFGQIKMRDAFNLQVRVLIATGIAIIVSRAINVAEGLKKFSEDAGGAATHGVGTGFWLTMLQNLSDVPWRTVYPDAGQIVLVVLFAIVFLFVSMPSLVKFLPFRAGQLRAGGAKRYLAEFIPPGHERDPDRLNDDEIRKLAADFRGNSFWPAGDNTARILFFFFFVVLLFVILPVPVWEVRAGAVYVALLAITGGVLTTLAFVTYKAVLLWAGEILVREPGK